MKVKVELTFSTAAPIGQKAGVDMWALGRYFSSVGGSKYLLKSQGEAASLTDAVEGLVAQVNEVVERHAPVADCGCRFAVATEVYVTKAEAEIINEGELP